MTNDEKLPTFESETVDTSRLLTLTANAARGTRAWGVDALATTDAPATTHTGSSPRAHMSLKDA